MEFETRPEPDDLIIIDFILDRAVELIRDRNVISVSEIEGFIDELLDVRNFITEGFDE